MLTNSSAPLHTIIQVPFGIKDGTLYEPKQVQLGKLCNCICPGCRRPLVAIHAMKGGQIPHFKHERGSSCQHGLESAVHLAVKQLIAKHQKLYLPELVAKINITDALGEMHAPTSIICRAGTHFFSSVRLEKWLINFRPDIIATSSTDGDFLIEVAFTSFVDKQKLVKINSQNTPLLQIDVSNFRSFSFDGLAKILFESSTYISWIYHPALAIKEEKLHFMLADLLNNAVEIAKQNDKEKEKLASIVAAYELQKSEQVKIQLAELAKQKVELAEKEALKIARFKIMSSDEKLSTVLRYLKIEVRAMPSFLSFKVRGASSFRVDSSVWQVSVFAAFVQSAFKRSKRKFNLNEVLEWVRLRFDVSSTFDNSEKVALWDFLDNLSRIGILESTGRQGFYVIQDNLKNIIKNIVKIDETPPKIYPNSALSKNLLNPNSSKLYWVDNWPSSAIVSEIGNKYSLKNSSKANWDLLIQLIPEAKNRTPQEIINIYSSKDSNSNTLVLNFMLEVGFVKIR